MPEPRPTVAEILAVFRGVYARVATKLDVDPSFVSRVANGKRNSAKIDAALRDELLSVKEQLEQFVRFKPSA